ncbi:hypothetical protein OIU78_027151 [Salix suchowensis]|nr:hypothetical protein OIU78_027151 [Salix suchowensis]
MQEINGEGAVPEDIGFLSSLRSLDLSKNNFVSLPKSINQLSRFEKLALKDCVMLESLPEVPLNVQKVKLDGCLRIKEIPDPIKLSSMKRSEFKYLNCWELYKHNGQNNLGLSMLEKYLQGSLPRPGFGIAIPGNDVLDWFNHQSKESSIRVQVPHNEWMGFAACVAFNAYAKSPLFCHFKVDGKENYPSPMYIGCNSMQVVSDHLCLFYLSFDYLKERKNEAFNNLELSFHSYERGVEVKNYGVRLGMKKDRIIRLLDSCGFYANIGMQALMEKSLITVSRDQIWMHSLLQQMGEDIVRRESPEEPGSRSRLYVYKDVCDALKNIISKRGRVEHESLLKNDQTKIAQNPQFNLKIINLINSMYLTNTPDFTGIPNLESLILEGCASLSEVHPSFGHHKKLQFMNLVDCISLRTLPSNLEMESLKACTLNGCSKLDKFPNIVGNMNCLRELRLDGTAIAELPSSFHRLISLVLLSMSGCKNLESVPNSISGLKSLKKHDVSDCSELKNIPENLRKVKSLEEFDASGTSIRQPPASFFHLRKLKLLSFNGCKRLMMNLTERVLPSLSGLFSLEELDLCTCNLGEGAVPEDIGFLSSLRILNLSRNNFVSLPKSINQLYRLEKLALKDCVMLESLPEVPINVQKVKLDGCLRLKEIPDPIKLSSMKRSEFKCLNCWELYKHNGQNNMGVNMLEKYLQGSLPRPGFGIVVPGNDVPDWFNHQSKESSVRVQVPHNKWMGFVACVAFSAYDLKEQKNEAFNNLECSFHSYEQGVKVKNCGVRLVNPPSIPSWQSRTSHRTIENKYIDSLANSLSYNQ